MARTEGMDVAFIETGTTQPIERYTGVKYDPNMTAKDFVQVIDTQCRLLVEQGTVPPMTWHIVMWPDDELPMVKLAIDSVDACLLNAGPYHDPVNDSIWNERYTALSELLDTFGRAYMVFEHHPDSENIENANFGFVVAPGELYEQQLRTYTG